MRLDNHIMFKLARTRFITLRKTIFSARTVHDWIRISTTLVIFVYVIYMGSLPFKFELIDDYPGAGFSKNNLKPAEIVLYFVSSVLFWHAVLFKLWWPENLSQSLLRSFLIRFLDYVWLGTAALTIIIGSFELRRVESLNQLKFVQQKIDRIEHYIAEAGEHPLQKPCSEIEQNSSHIDYSLYKAVCDESKISSKSIRSLLDHCFRVSKGLMLSDMPISQVYELRNSRSYDKISYICDLYREKDMGTFAMNTAKQYIDAANERPRPNTNGWIVIFLYALALRIVKTSAELAEIYWKWLAKSSRPLKFNA